MSLSVLESETPRWVDTPARRYADVTPPKMTLTSHGMIEIKPHTFSAISRGVTGLRKRLDPPRGMPRPHPDTVGLLVTYLPVRNNRVITSGVPTHVHVFVAPVSTSSADTPKAYQSAARWKHLGRAEVKPVIPHPPVDQMSAFGQAVEPVVQAKVREIVARWYPKVKFDKDTGGHRPGPDMSWTSLAELYAELGRDLRDPFWTELAAEMHALA